MSGGRSLIRVAACALGLLLVAGCDDAQDHLRRAHTAIFEKKADQALKQYRLALDLLERDESAQARVLQARALKGAADVYYLELRDFRRAAEVYQELIRVCAEAPEALEARIQLGDILHDHFHDTRGAIASYTSAIERNAPDSAELLYKVAKLYFELGDFQQASVEAQHVQQRYEASPFVDDAILLEAQAVGMMEGRQEDSFRAMEKLVEKFPDSPLVPFAQYEMGKIKAESGDREGAIDLWVQALKSHPEPQLVQDSIARVRKQIIERSPVVGVLSAFDHRNQAAHPVVHKTSLEAAGGSAEEAAHETGGD